MVDERVSRWIVGNHEAVVPAIVCPVPFVVARPERASRRVLLGYQSPPRRRLLCRTRHAPAAPLLRLGSEAAYLELDP